MLIKYHHLLHLLIFTIMSYSCQQKEEAFGINITDSNKLNEILDYYVDNDFYPFVYARIEDLDGKLIYEHSAVNQNLLADTKVDGDTWIRIWSMSKIVTISVVLDLIEDDILKIDGELA